jgi:hypothetical protein
VWHIQRCTSHAGHSAGRLMPRPPGSSGDEPPPAGTASRSNQPASPADVLYGERDWVRFTQRASRLSRNIFRCRLVPIWRGFLRSPRAASETRLARNRNKDSRAFAHPHERGTREPTGAAGGACPALLSSVNECFGPSQQFSKLILIDQKIKNGSQRAQREH